MSDDKQEYAHVYLDPAVGTADVRGTVTQRWRVPEFIGLGIALIVLLSIEAFSSEYDQYIPPGNVDGINGYPIRLGEKWCTAQDISACVDGTSGSGCCTEVEAGTLPGETVSSAELGALTFGIPLAVILTRFFLMKYTGYRGFGSTVDALLGLVFALGFCTVATGALKLLVGRPRPNYAALQALAGFDSRNASNLKSESIRSFPSGHASESMVGAAFATLLYWRDALENHVHRWTHCRRALAGYLSLWPILIATWVGVTRIRDYWHFQDDVLAGWIIGVVAAPIALCWISSPHGWKGDEMNMAPHVTHPV